ncbi:MAG: hypothetical protein AVDCRST_MAG53-551, partial [uncultured Solirubrobacteraceae bacterium]
WRFSSLGWSCSHSPRSQPERTRRRTATSSSTSYGTTSSNRSPRSDISREYASTANTDSNWRPLMSTNRQRQRRTLIAASTAELDRASSAKLPAR